MATKLYLRNTKVNGIHLNARDLIDSATTGGAGVQGVTPTTAGGTEIPVNASTPTEVGEWISDQIDQPVTIAGLITFKMWFYVSDALANATLRVKIWKVTAGGSDLLTFIGSFDATVEAGTSNGTVLDFTGTPSVAVLMAQRERFVVRLYVIPAPGQTMGGPYNATFPYAATSAGIYSSWLQFTETVGLLAEGTKLYLRNSTLSGVGSFLDMLPSRSAVAGQTAVVDTTASGSDIPWTTTAGGPAIEWISPRLVFNVPEFTTPSPWPFCSLFASESAGQANAQMRARLWKRNLAGTETLIWGPDDMGRELTTSFILETFGTNRMTASLAEDDRLVLRMYCHNFGTMGSGRTCTLKYDSVVASGEASIIIGSNNIAFKAESEPNGAPNRVPGGLTMGGVGN